MGSKRTNEITRLHAILTELNDRVASGEMPSAALIIALRGELEQMGPKGDAMSEDDTAELSPEGLELLTALSNTLGHCQNPVSTLRIFSANSDANHSLEMMFEHP